MEGLSFKKLEKVISIKLYFMDAAMSKRIQSEGIEAFHWYIQIDMKEGEFITEIDEEELEYL